MNSNPSNVIRLQCFFFAEEHGKIDMHVVNGVANLQSYMDTKIR